VARSILRAVTNWCGARPVVALNARAKWNGLSGNPSIQPMVQRQLRSDLKSDVARRGADQVSITVDLDAVVFVGVGLLLGLLIASVAFGGQGGAA
jgi:hypothetical protein